MFLYKLSVHLLPVKQGKSLLNVASPPKSMWAKAAYFKGNAHKKSSCHLDPWTSEILIHECNFIHRIPWNSSKGQKHTILLRCHPNWYNNTHSEHTIMCLSLITDENSRWRILSESSILPSESLLSEQKPSNQNYPNEHKSSESELPESKSRFRFQVTLTSPFTTRPRLQSHHLQLSERFSALLLLLFIGLFIYKNQYTPCQKWCQQKN